MPSCAANQLKFQVPLWQVTIEKWENTRIRGNWLPQRLPFRFLQIGNEVRPVIGRRDDNFRAKTHNRSNNSGRRPLFCVHKMSTQLALRVSKIIENSMANDNQRKSCHSDQKILSKYGVSALSRNESARTKTAQITAKSRETRRKSPGKIPG